MWHCGLLGYKKEKGENLGGQNKIRIKRQKM
jgi:hypothetical protein